MGIVLTLGYGSLSQSDLIAGLNRHGVRLVVDVRSYPDSGRSVMRRRELLPALKDAGIGYFSVPQLGGYDPRVKDGDYPALRQLPEFQHAIERLVEVARKDGTICLLCAESDPKKCHRKWAIQPELEQRGVEVKHLVQGKRAARRPSAPPRHTVQYLADRVVAVMRQATKKALAPA